MVAKESKRQKKLHSHVIYRYLTRELFIYFFIAFLFFFAVFFVNQILLTIEELLKQRVPLNDVLRLILYSLPSVVATSAPFATLVGFLMCLGRFVSDNEILVLRSTGHKYFSIFSLYCSLYEVVFFSCYIKFF